jgi:hypothetical protein
MFLMIVRSMGATVIKEQPLSDSSASRPVRASRTACARSSFSASIISVSIERI